MLMHLNVIIFCKVTRESRYEKWFCIRYAYFHILACVLHKSRSRLKKKCRSSLEKSTDREMQRRTEVELSFNERYWLTTNFLSFLIQIDSIMLMHFEQWMLIILYTHLRFRIYILNIWIYNRLVENWTQIYPYQKSHEI